MRILSRKRLRHRLRQYHRQPIETRWLGSPRFIRRNPTKVALAIDMNCQITRTFDEQAINGSGLKISAGEYAGIIGIMMEPPVRILNP